MSQAKPWERYSTAPQQLGAPDPMADPKQRKAEAEATVADRTVEAQIALANAQAAAAQAEANKAIASGNGAGATTAQTEVDKKYAQEYIDWRAAGGYAGLEGNLKLLEQAIGVLENSDNITGPVYGRLPKFIQQQVDPRGPDVRADVETVIQQSLKMILGGQFAMKEAEQLFARSFDPTQEESSNISRIRSTLDKLREQGLAKESSAKYYEENGTLAGWTGPTPQDRNAMTALRIGGDGGRAGVADRADVNSGAMTTDELPPGYKSAVDDLTASLVSEGNGRIDPQAFIQARNALDRQYGLPGTPPEQLVEWATSVNQYLDAGGRTIPSGVMPSSRLMTQTETMRNNFANSPVGGFLSGAGNAGSFGAIQALAPDQYAALGEVQGGSQLAGEIAGTIGGTAAVGGIGRLGAGRLAPSLLQGGGRGQFARNVATDATYGGGFGAVTEGDPLTGAAIGAGGSVAGQGVARGLGALAGGAQISDAARALRDRGVPISVARQMGFGRAEDAMSSIPIVGDMSRARQLDSFTGFNEAAMRQAGEPIGFNPTQVGAAGVADFGDAVGDAYTNATRGVSAPVDTQAFRDLRPVMQSIRGLPDDYRAAAETIMERRVTPALESGNITGDQFQQAVRGIRQARSNAGRNPGLAGFEQEFRDSLTGVEDLLTGTMTRGSGPDVAANLGAANAANRGFKTIEDASLNRANVGTQAGEANIFTPAQLLQSARSAERKGFGDNPLMELGRQGQEVLPSTLPNSGTTDRAIMTGILGSAGIGAGVGGGSGYAGGGEMQEASDGAQTGAITGASLAAALALLGSRQGQAGLQRLMIDRSPAAMSLGQNIRRRGGLFGSAGTAIALGGQ